MKITNTQSGESYHLDPDTELEIERTNLFFNEYGEQSLPVTLPDTDRNRKLCGYADTPANLFKPRADIEVTIRKGSYFAVARQAILSAQRKEGINTSFYLNEGAFLSRLSEIRLNEVFKDEYIPGIESVEQAMDWLEQLYAGNKDEKFACCEVQVDDGSTYRFDGSEITYRLMKLNEFDSSGKLKARQARTIYMPDDNTKKVVDIGYYVTPFIRTNYLLTRVLAYFGYTLEENFFTQTEPFKKMVLANTTADAIVNGRILINDLLPDISCGELLDVFRKRFLCEFIPDEANRTINVKLFREIIQQQAVNLPSSMIAGYPEVEYPEAYRTVVLKCSSVNTPQELPIMNNTEAVVSQYPYAIIDEYGQFKRMYVRYCSPSSYRDSTPYWSVWPEGYVILYRVVSSASTPYGIINDMESEEIEIPDSIAEMLGSRSGNVETGSFDGGTIAIYIGPTRWLNSRLLEAGEVEGKEDEGNTKPKDDSKMPVIFLFTWGADSFGYTFSSCGTRYGEYSLAMNGENGIFEKFYREYDNLLRNSLHSVRYKLLMNEQFIMATDVHAPVCIDGSNYLWNVMRYTLGKFHNLSECELYTTHLYEPVKKAPTMSELINIPEEYEWKVYNKVEEINEEEYNETNSKDLYALDIYVDIPPSKDLYDKQTKMYYREWVVRKSEDQSHYISNYIRVSFWMQVSKKSVL